VIWQHNNSTRFSAAAILGADRDGRDVWITVVKAGFDIATDGSITASQKQLPIHFAPVFAGDPARSGLLYDSDVDYAKVGVDLLVQGTVRTPQGSALRELLVQLEVDKRIKTLRVHGERTWCRAVSGVVPGPAQPFTEMALTYGQAFGGFDPVDGTDWFEANPAGCGFSKKRSDLIDRPAHRVEYANMPSHSPKAIVAGFGPIARHWLPRRQHAGTYDAAWLENRMPLLPTDFDERFFSAAPADQQFAQMPSQAPIRVVGMGDGPIEFNLPRLAFGVNVQTRLQSLHRQPRLRTVLVLTDSRQVVMTYADAMVCTGWKFEILDAEIIEKRFLR
jgi:hypothetical protein